MNFQFKKFRSSHISPELSLHKTAKKINAIFFNGNRKQDIKIYWENYIFASQAPLYRYKNRNVPERFPDDARDSKEAELKMQMRDIVI